jgi:hypothetical protein
MQLFLGFPTAHIQVPRGGVRHAMQSFFYPLRNVHLTNCGLRGVKSANHYLIPGVAFLAFTLASAIKDLQKRYRFNLVLSAKY